MAKCVALKIDEKESIQCGVTWNTLTECYFTGIKRVALKIDENKSIQCGVTWITLTECY